MGGISNPAPVALTHFAATLGADVALAASVDTLVMSTPSLSVGTWFIALSAEIVNGGAVAGDCELFLSTGSGAGSPSGINRADGFLPALTGGGIGLAFITFLVVTTAGSFEMHGYAKVAATVKALATSANAGQPTGYIAMRIA